MMASPPKSSPESDSDAESFDSILEPPQASESHIAQDSTTALKDALPTQINSEPLTPSSDLDIPPPPRTNNTFLDEPPSPVQTPTQRSGSGSSPDLVASTSNGNGTTIAATPVAPEISVTSPPAVGANPQPIKRRKIKSPLKNSSESTGDPTPVHGNVLEFGSKEEITRRVAFPAKMLLAQPNISSKDTWAFQKVFGYDDFFASGFVFIQPNGAKNAKNTMDNAYVFLVLEGTIEAIVHKTTYTLSNGGLFQVPRGNVYSIKNISARGAKLFFVQARKPQSTEESHASLLTSHSFPKPSSDASMLLHWLLPRLVDRFIRLRKTVLVYYQRYLARYEGLASGRRLYLLFFILGLVVRRLPFIGSPPILNIQLIRYT